jgi:hypothetical protein
MRFLLSCKLVSLESKPSSVGIGPVIVLDASDRNRRLLSLPISVGTLPLRRLVSRLSSVSRGKLPN